MPAHLKKDLENGGSVSQNEPEGRCRPGCLPGDTGRRVNRGCGKGKVVVDWWYRRVFVM